MPNAIRVVLVDDHPIVRDGLGMLLASVADMTVVGVAGNATDGVALAASLRPDVVVMDVGLPDRTGFEATHELLALAPSTRVLMLTMNHDRATLAAALRAGASGYVLKESSAREIVGAIRSVHSGQMIFSQGMSDLARELITREAVTRDVNFPSLTNREFDVLRLLSEERDNAGIAEHLGIAEKTVRNTISAILVKLRLATRADAGEFGRSNGLG